MGESQTHGILLKKTLLPNEDAILEFCTPRFGRLTLSVKKLARSQKRNAEIDFFRLLELNVSQRRNGYSLKSANTIMLFRGFENDFETNQKGFLWLETLRKVLPEEKEMAPLFHEIVEILSHTKAEDLRLCDVFFAMKMFQYQGIVTRFDQIRGEVFFDPRDFRFAKKDSKGSIKLSNHTRQILEFLRRSSFSEVFEKKEKFSPEDLKEVQKILSEIEKTHE